MAVRWSCDTSRWPLVTLSVPPGTDPKDIDQDSFYEEADAILRRGERYGVLLDLRLRAPVDTARRRRFADWTEKNHAELVRLQICGAHVVENALQAGLVTAVFWLVKPPSPTRAFSDPVPATKWLLEQIERDRQHRAA